MDIEDLHRVVVQGFASLNDKIDSGLTSVNQRIDNVDSGLASVNQRIDNVESGLASVNQRIDSLQVHMDTEFGRVKDALMEHGRQLKDIRAALDRKVDRDELSGRASHGE